MGLKIIFGDKEGQLHSIEVAQLLEIEVDGISKFRFRRDEGKLRLMTSDGYLIIEPVASNVVLISQKDDV